MSRTEVRDLLANLGKAFVIFLSVWIPLYAAGGEGRELLTPLLPALGYLAAAYNVPLRHTMAPSEKRLAPRGDRPLE